MQGRRGNGDPFSGLGDPFAGFGGFGGGRSIMSSFFGGRDPFDDPFFTRPFGGMFESSFFGPSGNPFPDMHQPAFIERQAPEPQRSRGPIIEELDSDDEKEAAVTEKKENPRKHGRSSNGPFVEDPDDEVQERKSRQLQYRNDHNNAVQSQPQTHSFSFSSSTVTYGGSNGAYYTSSRTRSSGSDGLTFEESKEADSTTRQASHRVSRGLYDKGHTVQRKLHSDGKVDAMQTLHNLTEDEIAGFEKAWDGNARKHLPGWAGSGSALNDIGASSGGQNPQPSQGGQSLPAIEHSYNPGRPMMDRSGSSRSHNSGKMKHRQK